MFVLEAQGNATSGEMSVAAMVDTLYTLSLTFGVFCLLVPAVRIVVNKGVQMIEFIDYFAPSETRGQQTLKPGYLT